MSNTESSSTSIRHTVVEEGTEFKGVLSSSCPIDVRGRIEGEVSTPELTVSASGAVHGRAKVGAVRSEGELSGEFDADSVELAGTVRDNTVIRSRSLDVKLASVRGKLQVIFGECELSVGDEPHVDERVEAPVQPPADAAVPMMLAVAAAGDAAPMASAPDDGDGDGDGDEAEADDEEGQADPADASADSPRAKRRRKRKNGQPEDALQGGWSQPPSQPPPAS